VAKAFGGKRAAEQSTPAVGDTFVVEDATAETRIAEGVLVEGS